MRLSLSTIYLPCQVRFAQRHRLMTLKWPGVRMNLGCNRRLSQTIYETTNIVGTLCEAFVCYIKQSQKIPLLNGVITISGHLRICWNKNAVD
jgi:hypothetical protein